MKSIHDYKLGSCIGTGGFATVHRATSYITGQEVAIKMINKRRILRKKLGDRVKREVEIHSRLKHPSILELYDVFEDDDYVYLILELAHHGDVLQYIRDHGPVSENEARNYMKSIVAGVQYLHSHNIIHRDLTLANTILTRDRNVKIGDFGLATFAKPGVTHNTLCGTPNYISPEVVRRYDHGLAVDLWSLGCILYTLLVGSPPFEMDTVHGTLDRVVAGDYVIPNYLKHHASDLIRSLLSSDPSKRPRLPDILNHPFMIGEQFSVREKSDDSGRGSTHGGIIEIPAFPAESEEKPSTRLPGEPSTPRSRDDGIGSNHTPSPVPSGASSHSPRCPSHDDAILARASPKSDAKDGELSRQSCRRSSEAPASEQAEPSVANDRSGKSGEREEASSTSDLPSGPLCTSRLKPIRVRLRRAFANILDDGNLCFEFLCPRRTSVATVIEVFEVSPDGRRISVVRTPKPGWPTSEDLPPLRTSSAPGRVVIYSFDNLPAKYHRKYGMAANFVHVCRSRTPKVTLLSNQVKCVLMENGHDCVVSWRTEDSSPEESSAEVSMSQNFCRVVTQNSEAFAERPGQLAADAQKLYCDAAVYRERCREVEAALTRLDPDHSFPVVVGSRRQVVAPSPSSLKLCPQFAAEGRGGQDETGDSDSVSTNLSCVVKSRFVADVGWSQQLSSGHVRALLNDGSELFLLPQAPIVQVKAWESRGCETFDLRRQFLPERLSHVLRALPFLPPAMKTILHRRKSEASECGEGRE